MPVVRSAFANSAPRAAKPGSAPTNGDNCRANASIRLTRAAWLPSFAWKVMPSRAATRSASFVRRSKSQKCRASENRARSTRSLPAMIAAPPSMASMLAAKAKRGAAAPNTVRSAKYRWFTRMLTCITSGGRSM